MAHCPNGPVFSLVCGRRSAVIFIGGMSISAFEARARSRRRDRFREGYLVNVNLRVRYPGEVTDTSCLDTFSPMVATHECCYHKCDSRVIGERDIYEVLACRFSRNDPSSIRRSHQPEIVRRRCAFLRDCTRSRNLFIQADEPLELYEVVVPPII